MEIPRHWRLNGQRYGLTGSTCGRCGKTFFTPRPVCDGCNAPVVSTYSFGQRLTRQELVQVYEPAQR